MIKLLIDSSSDYLPSEAQERGMYFVPLSITFGETTYRSDLDLDRDTFYDMLTTRKDSPKTSQPSPQDFLDYFEEAKANGDELICILLSSALSGTYQSATLAKSMADYDGIYLVDSLSATHGVRLLADHAADLITQGKPASEIVEKLESLKKRISICAAVDTLEYLCRGGRVSRAAATIGEIANLKPVITVNPDGTVGVLGKCLGKNKTMTFILKHLQEHKPDPEFPIYSVNTYGNSNCERFEQKMIQSGYDFKDRLQIGATIGTHIGPEVFGVIYITK